MVQKDAPCRSGAAVWGEGLFSLRGDGFGRKKRKKYY